MATTRQIDATASLGLNNLSAHGSMLALASKHRVPIVNAETATSSTVATIISKDEAAVVQCKWCTFDEGTAYLVLALKTGVQVWSADGKRMYLWAPLVQVKDLGTAPFDPDMHCSGIAAFSIAGKDCLCVGTSTGVVLIFHHEGAQSAFTMVHSLRAKAAGETEPCVSALDALARDGSVQLARADDAGTIQLWRSVDGQNFDLGAAIAAEGLACTGVCLRGNLVASAYSNGEIRVHSSHSGTLLASAAAHARWINALALHPSEMVLATASEDTHVSVWALEEAGESATLSKVAYWSAPDALFCGVAFHGPGGNTVTASAYDSATLMSWMLP
mmetsp:Transcript_2441/g.7161  ORF Transcript_2441/g.7161 Transcript_2441/m.7161 type:complete len:331 (+) Transcript_2441:64-1056(+)